MKCDFCGSDILSGINNCPACGAPVTAKSTAAFAKADNSVPAAAPEINTCNSSAAPEANSNNSSYSFDRQIRCTSCGAALPAGTRFCPECGCSLCGLSQEEQVQKQQKKDAFWNDIETEAEEQRKSRRKSSIISWILHLAGLAVVIYLINYIAN